MTKDEMQRYLIQQAQLGVPEFEAYRRLMEILGLQYPDVNSDGGNVDGTK